MATAGSQNGRERVVGQTMVRVGDVLELRFVRGVPVVFPDGQVNWKYTQFETFKILLDRDEWLVVVVEGDEDEKS